MFSRYFCFFKQKTAYEVHERLVGWDVYKRQVIYEMVPGFFLSMLAIVLVSTFTSQREQKRINREFSEMEAELAVARKE